MDATQAATPTEQVNAMSHRGHVLHFDAVLIREGESQRRPASGEGIEDGGSWEIGIPVLAAALARIARPDLIDGVCAIDSSFGELHGVLAVAGIVDPGGK